MGVLSGMRRLSPVAVLAVLACALALGVMTAAELVAGGQRRASEALVASIVDRGDAGLVPAHDGRLVRIVGSPRAEGAILDPLTGARIAAIAARREVEMVQRIGRRDERGAWQVTTGWSGRAEIPYDGTTASLTQQANPPFAIPSGEIAAEAARIGPAAVDGALARRSQFHAYRATDPEAFRDAVAGRFPDRSVRVDGDWLVIARTPDAVAVGDVRVRYRVADDAREVTVVGRQREGRLVSEPVPGIATTVVRGRNETSALLDASWRDGPGDTVFWGRAGGLGILALALAFVAFGGLRQRPAGEGGGWVWGVVALGAAGGDDPVSAVVGIVALLALAPFAIAAAPVGIGLAALAWVMAQGAVQMAVGLALATLAAASALVLTAHPAQST